MIKNDTKSLIMSYGIPSIVILIVLNIVLKNKLNETTYGMMVMGNWVYGFVLTIGIISFLIMDFNEENNTHKSEGLGDKNE